jgi:hypothetical protein
MIRLSLRMLFERNVLREIRQESTRAANRSSSRWQTQSRPSAHGFTSAGFAGFRAIARMRRLPFDQRYAIRKRVTLCRRPSAN